MTEIARDYLEKSAKVLIEEYLKTQKCKDKQGIEKTRLATIANELQMLSKPKDQPIKSETYPQEDFDDEDIPF